MIVNITPMPRHRRLEIPGAIFHVMTRGIEGRELFKDDPDRKEFLKRLEEALKKGRGKCYGWVLMPNHFHLLIRTGTSPLSDMMRKVLTGYAIYFNWRHNRRGYLYQNRYKSILCQEETYLLELIRYIHLNPLRAGIVEDMDELKRYAWSGHAALAGGRPPGFQSTGEVLERFGKNKMHAQKKYMEFMKDAKDMGKRDDLTGGGLRRSAGGWQGVQALKRANEYWRGDERVLGDGDFVNQVLRISDEEMIKKDKLKKDGWNIKRLIQRVCAVMGITEEEIKRRSRGTAISEARGLAAYWGYKELGIPGSEIGNYFGITRPSVCVAIKRGEKVAKERGVNLII